MLKTTYLSKVIWFAAATAYAQWPAESENPAWVASDTEEKPSVRVSGVLDTYYAMSSGSGGRQPDFLFNHTKTDNPAINLALIQVELENHSMRGSLGLMAGTYPEENLSAEPDGLRNIFEAYAGWCLSKQGDLWLDAGVFASHIGFESAIQMDNFTLTRSILAENSPYFESGLRLTYTPNDTWEFAGLVLNGWQRIRPIDGNSMPSFGTRITYTPSDRITCNWSTFIGTDFTDEERRMRYFSNLYVMVPLAEKLDMIAGFDIGFQERDVNDSSHDVWWSPVAIIRYQLSSKWSFALRGEYYADPDGVIVSQAGPAEILGASLNIDYKIHENAWIRSEVRHLENQSAIFERGNGLSRGLTSVTTSFSIRF